MSFTDGKPWSARENDLRARWSFGKPGEAFRCGICGYKFKLGDIVRWMYTNNIPGYGLNPLLCEKCDGPDALEKWKAHVDEWNSVKDKFWKFIPYEIDYEAFLS